MPSLDILKNIFEDFNESTTSPNWSQPVSQQVQYPTVQSTDWEPVNIINPNIDKGPWIAGGACLRWYQGLPVADSDIDVFCSSAIQAKEVIDRIKSYGRFSTKFESDNAVTLDYWPSTVTIADRWTLQVITKRYYSSIQEVIDGFDVTVCQIATAGDQFVLGNWTARDVRERNLRMPIPLQADAVKRLTKYWTYGYRPVPGLLDAVKNNPLGRWEFSPGEDYQ
jgi:hypothetical protein